MFKNLMQTLWMLSALALSSAAFAAPVAYVHDQEGTALLAGKALKTGDTLEQGASIATSGDGKTTIKFQDGQLVALQPNTRFEITTYRYNTANIKESSIALNMLKGALRFVTGVIGATNHRAFRLATPTATIGIRGTDGVVSFDEATKTASAATSQGALELNTPFGTAVIPANTYSAAPANQPPIPAAPLVTAPPQIVQNVAQLTQREMPNNTPVVVSESAKAAAAREQAEKASKDAEQKSTDESKKAAEAAKAAAEAAEAAAARAAAQATEDAAKAGAVMPTPPVGTSQSSSSTSSDTGTKTSSTATSERTATADSAADGQRAASATTTASTPSTTGSSGSGGGGSAASGQ